MCRFLKPTYAEQVERRRPHRCRTETSDTGDVVKIELRSVVDDSGWSGYPYADSTTSLNGAGTG
jgi:hypothetical protein